MLGRYGYEVDDRAAPLGRGRHCIVKLATSTRHAPHRKVAIKIVNGTPTAAKEAEILFRLNHENVVEIFDYFVHNDLSYIVLALAENGNLRTFVRQRARLGQALVRKFLRQVFDAVTYLHDTAAVAHCDLKSENILVDADEDLKVSDFGLAVELGHRSSKECDSQDTLDKPSGTPTGSSNDLINCHKNVSSCADSGTILLGGSPSYAAPEILDGCPAVDLRAADVWSAGVIAFYILTTYLPFGCHGNKNIREAMGRPLRWPRPLRQITKASRTFVQSVLVVEPSQRPTAREAFGLI
ncbi:uncharacterized protein [Diadema setosum]|uniref:uncharacterized protein n=1 Tax=Diadema setosum TaxID=31175 RepID=UPI003B3A039F